MPSQTKERINNLIDMDNYFTNIVNDVDGKILEIPSPSGKGRCNKIY